MTRPRRPFVAGNWKMNLDRAAAVALAQAIRAHAARRGEVDVALIPPFVYLEAVRAVVAGSNVRLGAQNMCDQPAGAFTGEISGAMLRDLGCDLVVLGHSERRHVFGETDALVSRKVRAALGAGLAVILCVGETQAERGARRTEDVVRRQLEEGLKGVAREDLARVTLAYEPVWAIGTGVNATPEQAGEVHAYLRGLVAGMFGDGAADALRIQYGGSVSPTNIQQLMAVDGVDGVLVGGASLKAESFQALIDQAR
jgi:triosephosphate isomerase